MNAIEIESKANALIEAIKESLVKDSGRTQAEAEDLVMVTRVKEYIISEDPNGPEAALSISPSTWSRMVLELVHTAHAIGCLVGNYELAMQEQE